MFISFNCIKVKNHSVSCRQLIQYTVKFIRSEKVFLKTCNTCLNRHIILNINMIPEFQVFMIMSDCRIYSNFS